MPKALIFANGDSLDGPMVRRMLQSPAQWVIAADGGARVALYYGYVPHVVIGDFDSLTDDEQHDLESRGVSLLRYPAEKDETDLELALQWAARQGAESICVVGGIGDRLDQTLANVYLLALPELRAIDVELVAGRQSTRLVSAGTHTLSGTAEDTLSLLPLGGAVHGVTTDGLKYPLTNETLAFGPARGVSNVMLDHRATLTFNDGLLLVIHTLGRA